ncbi:MAG: hypothetical protein HC850_15800 [Rhodomicrobium sp.]|nr:hypothetical protein [Rhodomicrobium sp.]
MSVVLLNPFRVFDGKEAEFLDLWDRTNRIFAAKSGYLHARLVKALDDQPPGQSAPFTHANIAIWESARAYAEALADPELRRLAGLYRQVCTFDPALYEVIRDMDKMR